MSWEFVFNTNLYAFGKFKNIQEAAYIIGSATGYKFFTWNGFIYYILSNYTFEDTKINVSRMY